MKVYCIEWTDNAIGPNREWAATNAAALKVAAGVRAAWEGDEDDRWALCGAPIITAVEVPTTRRDIIPWLNRWALHDTQEEL